MRSVQGEKVALTWVGCMLYGRRANIVMRSGDMYAFGMFMVSFGEPIAFYHKRKFYVTNEKFSRTTSSHVSAVVSAVRAADQSALVMVDRIEDGLERAGVTGLMDVVYHARRTRMLTPDVK